MTCLINYKNACEEMPSYFHINRNDGSVWAPAWKLWYFCLAIFVFVFQKARSYSNLIHHINKHKSTLIENGLEISVILYKYLGIFHIKIQQPFWAKCKVINEE